MDLFDQVIRTKVLTPDRHSKLLSRQRLLDLLYELLNYRLVIITAPTGYGKTSLLVDLAYKIDLPVCWCTLDIFDQDPWRLIIHFLAAIDHRFPLFGERAREGLQGMTQATLDLDQVVAVVVNEVYKQIQEHFVLVLDDYHLISDNEEINYFVDRFIQQVSENCHLIVSSRNLLTLPNLALMVARSQVGAIGFNELAFQTDEIQAILLQNYGQTIPESVAQELVQETEGWITGLLLSAQIMWPGMIDRLRLARVSGVGLYDYLAQQVLNQQSAQIQDFLLYTSLLDEFDAHICETILEPVVYPEKLAWSSLIKSIIRRNLFVLPIDPERKLVRYHHLFRDFLKTRLRQKYPDIEIRILRQLAIVYEEDEVWEKAHAIYHSMGDVKAIADLIEQAALPLMRRGQLRTLSEWLDALPPHLLATRPVLLSIRGDVAVNMGEVEKGITLLHQAEITFREEGNQAQLARTLVRQAMAYRFLGNYQMSSANSDEALGLVEEEESEEFRVIEAEALRTKGIALLKMGQLNAAIQWLTKSLAVYEAIGKAENVKMILMEVGLAYMDIGAYSKALRHYNKGLDYWRRTNNVAQQASLLNNLGVLYYRQGHYEQAISLFEEALGCASRVGLTFVKGLALASIGDLYANLDAPDAALDAYRQTRQIISGINYHFLQLYLSLAEVSLARQQNDLIEAKALLRLVEQLVQENQLDYEYGLYCLETGRVMLAEGDISQGLVYLEQAECCFKEGEQIIENIWAGLSLARAYHLVQDEPAMLEKLEQVFQLAGEMEHTHSLVVASRQVKPLLQEAREIPMISSQVSWLLKEVDEFERSIPNLRRCVRQKVSVVSFSPPKLAIQVLGKAGVTLDGLPVTNPEWQTQRRVRDLFFYVLAHLEGITKEKIGVIFWPNSSTTQLKSQFKNTIYRLRCALGKEVVLFDESQNCYQFNRGLDYDYDVETFQKQLRQAQAEAEPVERIVYYEAAIDLYKGDYLPENEEIWVLSERERLCRDYINAVLDLAEIYLGIQKYEKTVEYCQYALNKDACNEGAHRLAMRAYAANGNQVEVIRQFERCHRALREEIDVSPSPQTTTLFETLLHGEVS
jgi:ATP/maltotriose-dependent transcriptional regulator MalT/DNA-binding SARP family transcriptional activator